MPNMDERIRKILTNLWSQAFDCGVNHKIATGSHWKDATDEALSAILSIFAEAVMSEEELKPIIDKSGMMDCLVDNGVDYDVREQKSQVLAHSIHEAQVKKFQTKEEV